MSKQTTLLDVITETLDTIERYKRDPDVTPETILDSMEMRVCLMLKKMIATPTSTSYCIFKPAGYSSRTTPDSLV